MPDVRQYETADGQCPFARWFSRLEARAAAKVARTVAKLEAGGRPDVKAVGEGVFEARVDFGPGYRVYFGLDGTALVVLLGGGDKRGQATGHTRRAGMLGRLPGSQGPERKVMRWR